MKATYCGTCMIPGNGTVGTIYKAGGFYDPDSAEYEAYLFQPDGEEDAYYVAREDFEIVA